MSDPEKSKTLPQYIAALSICLGAVAAGAVLGWTANISDALQNGDLNDISISDDEKGWIGSFVTVGAMVVCFPIGIVCDRIGRKWSCLLAVIPFSVGWLLVIFSNNLGMIYAGRFLTGFASGIFCVVAPIYTSEIAENSIRGALGSYFQLNFTIGILLAYAAGAEMSPQGLAILLATVPIIFAVVFFFQPETPVYLLKNNKREEAKKALHRLRGSAYDCEPEIKEMQEIIDKEASMQISFFDAVKTKAAKKSAFISFGLMFFQQLSGVNAVIVYTADIFAAAGSSLDPALATVIVGFLQTAATLVSSLVVDKFGRKILLLLSVVSMGISQFVLALFFSFKDRKLLDEDAIEKIGILPILCLGIFIIMFSMGFGPIPWMISAEIMPPEVKSTLCSIAATLNWLLAFIVTRFYGNLKNSIGGDSTFYIFSGICCIGCAFVFMFVPETKGKSIAEVQAYLNGEKLPNKKQGIDNPSFQ